jgi:phosphoglycerate dehydrogenase-like enzyme
MNIVLYLSIGTAEIETALTAERCRVVTPDGFDALAETLPEAEGLITSNAQYDARMATLLQGHAERLRWLQFTSSGFDALERYGFPQGVVISNAGSVWAPAVAEHAMALLLASRRRVDLLERARQQRIWCRGMLERRLSALEGGTLVIVGFGEIGKAIARRAKAFDMRVIALARTARRAAEADLVAGIGELDNVLPLADALILAVPLSGATRHLIDGRRLSLLKRSCTLVNVSRGEVVDEAALIEALAHEAIAGAALDVFETEPLLATSALWGFENVVLSPHVAGLGNGRVLERTVELCTENLRRIRTGQPLANRVEPVPSTK